MDWIAMMVFVLMLSGLFMMFLRNRRSGQLAYINGYHFHQSIRAKITNKYPHLDDEQLSLVFSALRDYFWMCHRARRKMVAMPSQVVDDAWHEFILFTRAYEIFCQKAIGRFLHHTPTEAMSTPTLAQEGIKRAWRLACAKDEINPATPDTLPLIFAIDALLQIPNGFSYSLNCRDKNSPAYGDGYCAGHIGCSSGCAGDTALNNDSGGFFDGLFDSSGGSDCGGGGCSGD